METKEYAPSDLSAYSKWVIKSNPKVIPLGTIRTAKDTGIILDAWGEPIVLVLEGRCVVGLGSSGQNRVWDDGGNDDVVVSFAEFGVPIGPAGSSYEAPEQPVPNTQPPSGGR
jgi:hypothetical protein